MKLEPIDTSTTAGKARVMQLAAEGRRLAFADEGVVQDEDIEEVHLLDVDWNWSKFEYFIIAEPVGPEEVWVQQRSGALWAYPEERDGSVRYVRAEQ